MKTRYLAVAIALAITGALGVGTAHAAAPNVTVTDTPLGVGAHRITATITGTAASITGYPNDGTTPSTSGGCHLVWHYNARHRAIIDGTACTSAGTVTYTTAVAPPCESMFTLTATNGPDVTTITVTLGEACPPPPPPAIVVTVTGDITTLQNPATIDQSVSIDQVVPGPECTYSADAPMTYQVYTRFAGVGPNRYTYLQMVATFDPIPAGTTVTMTRTC